jgi:ribonuclease VapC
MVVDTSALMAIMLREPSRPWFLEQLNQSGLRAISAPTALEFRIVLEARRPQLIDMAPRVLRDGRIRIVDFTADLAERGQNAWHRFGKGRHPAALNLGDCCTYALAEETGLPILCTGNDFAQTDLPVLRPPEG